MVCFKGAIAKQGRTALGIPLMRLETGWFIRRLTLLATLVAIGWPAHAAPPPKLLEAQIEQLAAPIALHPDALLAQILMASTYPLELVEAARWMQRHLSLTPEQREAELPKQGWDESVRSLAAFPQILQMMSDELAWTQQLGDAVLAQQEDVLAAVQRLRGRADAQRVLTTTKEQTAEARVASAPEDGGAPATTYTIRATDPDIVYVPAYDPALVYGPWPYPEYPPYSWAPPGYPPGRRGLWFSAGVTAGRALWGFCDWRHHSLNIEVDRYNRFTPTNLIRQEANFARWEHNEIHRRGMSYRTADIAARYGRDRRNAATRVQFRGHGTVRRIVIVTPPPRDTFPRLPGYLAPERGARLDAGGLQHVPTPQQDSSGIVPPVAATPPLRHQTAFHGLEHGYRVRLFSDRGFRSRSGDGVRNFR